MEALLKRLSNSSFRSRFHLKEADKKYIAEKGLDTIRRHADDFIATRLAPANPVHDGKQTPMRGHPVFIAQHATATCCRQCLFKWYRIPQNVSLTPKQQNDIVNLIMYWIEKENGTL